MYEGLAPKLKFLCICEQGDNRSVHLSYLLKKLGYEAIAIGTRETSLATFNIFKAWADRVILLDKNLVQDVPKDGNVEVWDIGADRFPRPLNRELLDILNQKIEQNLYKEP